MGLEKFHSNNDSHERFREKKKIVNAFYLNILFKTEIHRGKNIFLNFSYIWKICKTQNFGIFTFFFPSPLYSRLSDRVGNLWLCRWCIPTHHPVNDTWTPKRFTNAEYFCWLYVRCLGCEKKKNVDWISKSKDDRSTLSHSSSTPLELL